MIADVKLDRTTIIGVEGNDVDDIKDIVASNNGLSEYGKSKLVVIVRNNEQINV